MIKSERQRRLPVQLKVLFPSPGASARRTRTHARTHEEMIWEWDDDPQHTGKWVPYSQEQNTELNTALTAGTRTTVLCFGGIR